jgi:hypothetical protein
MDDSDLQSCSSWLDGFQIFTTCLQKDTSTLFVKNIEDIEKTSVPETEILKVNNETLNSESVTSLGSDLVSVILADGFYVYDLKDKKSTKLEVD